MPKPFQPSGHPERESARLPYFDYTAARAYFITLCVLGRRCLFGRVTEARNDLSPLGKLVDSEWAAVATHRPGISLICHVVMPNHFHAIVRLPERQKANRTNVDQPRKFAPLATGSLSAVVGVFKSVVTRKAREQGLTRPKQKLWQPRFYDRVIRTSEEFARIDRYIADNPLNWSRDRENESRTGENDFYRWLDSLGKDDDTGG
ncbi:MAG: hypothetical protein IT462_05165 [Planctomycetes bacterium]|nr:hypothetical protein [Planctomycetota bacterium]